VKSCKEWGEGHRAGLSLGKYELEGGSSLENTTIYNAGANVCYPLFADMGGTGVRDGPFDLRDGRRHRPRHPGTAETLTPGRRGPGGERSPGRYDPDTHTLEENSNWRR
jgi:hypothetical protein